MKGVPATRCKTMCVRACIMVQFFFPDVYNSACAVSPFFLRFCLSIDDVAFEGGKKGVILLKRWGPA